MQSAWQALYIAREPISLGIEQPCRLDAARVLSQPLLKCLQAALSRLAGNEIGFLRDQGIQLRDHVAGRLVINEAEAREDRERNHAKYLKGPLENRPSQETSPAHRAASCPRRLIISGPQGRSTLLRSDRCVGGPVQLE